MYNLNHISDDGRNRTVEILPAVVGKKKPYRQLLELNQTKCLKTLQIKVLKEQRKVKHEEKSS
jgi:hypothetical protein